MAYTKTGPFVDNSAPGVGATFLNNVENMLSSINTFGVDANITSDGNGLLSAPVSSINAKQVNINGATAGNIVCYQPFVAPNFKVVIMFFNGYQNNGGHTQGVVIPVPFTQRSLMWCGDLPSTGVQFQLHGSSATLGVLGLANGQISGSSATNTPTLQAHSLAECLGGWDTMILPGSGNATVSGVLLVIGW